MMVVFKCLMLSTSLLDAVDSFPSFPIRFNDTVSTSLNSADSAGLKVVREVSTKFSLELTMLYKNEGERDAGCWTR